MADTAPTPYVAREADLDTLKAAWTSVLGGESQTISLTAPLGGGKRAIVGELCRSAIADTEDDVLLWRVNVREEDEGMAVILRAYAALFQAVNRSQSFRGKVEMALNSRLPSQPKRVQGWYQSFIDGLRKAKPAENGQVKVNLPQDNPLVGLIEITTGIARKFPVILDVHGLHNSHSVGLMAFLEALIGEAKDGARLLTVLSMEPIDDAAKAWMSPPLMEMLDRMSDNITAVTLSPWELRRSGSISRAKSLRAMPHASLTSRRVALDSSLSLVTYLKNSDQLGADLSGMTMANLADLSVDESEPRHSRGTCCRGRATLRDSQRR